MRKGKIRRYLPKFLGVLASGVEIIKQVVSHLESKSIDMVSDCDSLGDVIIAGSRVSRVEIDRQWFRWPGVEFLRRYKQEVSLRERTYGFLTRMVLLKSSEFHQNEDDMHPALPYVVLRVHPEGRRA